MKKLFVSLVALIVLGLPAIASADTITFQAPATAPNAGNGGPNQFELDHHYAYTWRINNVDLTNKTLTGATLTFHHISNWDTNPNILFINLLDTAKNAGVNRFQDASFNEAPVPQSDFKNEFDDQHIGNNPLVAPGTAHTLLTSHSFTTTPVDFVYTFTADQLKILSAYFLNGKEIAFGFDPDCHFWNNGITFSIQTTNSPTPTPEPTTMALLGTGLAGLYYRRRRSKARSEA